MLALCLVLSCFRVSLLEPNTPLYIDEPALSQRDNGYFTTTVQGRLNEDMPEFSFDIEACFDTETSSYKVRSVTVRDEERILQVISVPELTLFGETAVWLDQEETMGLELEDVNFDGYKDIRLFDTPNGNYRLEWIYLVWDPKAERFDHDPRLNEICLAVFDQEDQLIYGMERGGANRHYYYTYQYLDGEPVRIREESSVYLGDVDPEIRRRCLEGTHVTDETVEIRHDTTREWNPDTGEMELTRDEFVFLLLAEETERKIVMQVPAGSKMGELLSEEER